MKKVVRSIAVVALMFVTATGLAKEPKFNVIPNGDMSLSFEMDATLEQTFVSIVDANGVIIYKESIRKGKVFAKKFDLENLPEGNYFLEVENTLKEIIFGFTLDDAKISIKEPKENPKPVFRQKDGRVFLNLLNLEREDVKIKVLDSDGRTIFQEMINDEMLIEKVFNFEDAFKDDYTISVKNKTDIYFESVSVK